MRQTDGNSVMVLSHRGSVWGRAQKGTMAAVGSSVWEKAVPQLSP